MKNLILCLLISTSAFAADLCPITPAGSRSQLIVATLPTSPAAAASQTIDVLQFIVDNSANGTTSNVTLTNLAGTAVSTIISVPANSFNVITTPFGYFFNGGFNWSASQAGVNVQAFGCHQ